MTAKVGWQQNPKVTPIKTMSSEPYSAIIFPPNPSVGDQFTAPNGATYQWDGQVWFSVGGVSGGGSNVPIGSSPPSNAVSGQLWWRNDPDGTLFILYNDGTSTQWVPATQLLPGNGGLADAPSDGNMYVRRNGAWVQITQGIADAPSDGTLYGRQDATWTVVP